MFALKRAAPDGATEGDHLASGVAQLEKLGIKSKAADGLKAPPFPRALGYLWSHYIALWSGVRGHVTWQDLLAWTSLMKLELAPWEVDVLMQLDDEWHKAMTPKNPQPGIN